MLLSASDKADVFARMFSRNSNLDDSDICLFSLNLKEHNISAISKLFEKVITNLDMSKVPGPDCIPMVVLKGCEYEISQTLAKLFNVSLK